MKMTKIKTDNAECGGGCGEARTFTHCTWGSKTVHPLWKSVWRFLILFNIKLLQDPAIPLLSIYPRGMGKKSSSKSLVYCLTPVRMAIVNKSTNNKCWQGCGEKGTLVHCLWECRLVQTLWRTVWGILRNKKCNCQPWLPWLSGLSAGLQT